MQAYLDAHQVPLTTAAGAVFVWASDRGTTNGRAMYETDKDATVQAVIAEYRKVIDALSVAMGPSKDAQEAVRKERAVLEEPRFPEDVARYLDSYFRFAAVNPFEPKPAGRARMGVRIAGEDDPDYVPGFSPTIDAPALIDKHGEDEAGRMIAVFMALVECVTKHATGTLEAVINVWHWSKTLEHARARCAADPEAATDEAMAEYRYIMTVLEYYGGEQAEPLKNCLGASIEHLDYPAFRPQLRAMLDEFMADSEYAAETVGA
jgi:hypothetical protein